MNIIYIAYCCAPYNGSEASIGWETPLHSSKYNEVWLITVPESKPYIEKYMKSHVVDGNLHINYVDIPQKDKIIFRGILYTFRLNRWHKEARKLVKKICTDISIDIIHQLTPVEFRSIGHYENLNSCFLAGPVGGGEYVPDALKYYLKSSYKSEMLRKIANRISWLKLKFRNINILYANEETKNYINKKDLTSNIITEIGISKENIIARHKTHKIGEPVHFLVAGRLLWRKGHMLLLDALKQLPDDANYLCKIVGSGPYAQVVKSEIDRGHFKGKVLLIDSVPYSEMREQYSWADVLIMPSLRETTGTVLLEAMANGLPIISVNRFGGKIILNDDVAWFYDGNTKDEFVTNLSKIILSCINDSKQITEKAQYAIEHAKRFTWEEKVNAYQRVYKKLIGESNDTNTQGLKTVS